MATIHLSLFVILCWGVHRSSLQILHREKRNWIIDSFLINESYTGPFPYSLGKINVENNLTLFRIKGQGADENPKNILQINEHTGEVTVHGQVDYEKFRVLKLKFQALNKDNHEIDTQLGIEIQIRDANDHAPKFEHEWYNIVIEESLMQGSDVFVIVANDYDSIAKFKTFDLKIVSVTPKPHDLEFYLTQATGASVGTLSFYGCLDHERADKYTIVVEAKDHGDIPLSSSCTIVVNINDGNNHIPVITGQTVPAKVKEGEENVLITRLQVKDEDAKGTPAWRVNYQIKGDKKNNFNITRDLETNEGLLYVKKGLDYEDSSLTNLTISIENEIKYFSCKVIQRKTIGLWQIQTTGGIGGINTGTVSETETLGQFTYQLTVMVEDVNEAPIFDQTIQKVTLIENTVVGQYLVTFTARDPDVTSKNKFVFIKGHDPADWVTVDSKTGKITTSKVVDRESTFLTNNIYQVTIYAVDDGKPPMTSTATLSIHIADENDNVPILTVSQIHMCQLDGASLANITALDLDEDPYSGPFSFKLLGDVKGKWRIDPARGYSVNLVKEEIVHSGIYELKVEVSDRQHQSAVHNLSVTVCSCYNPEHPNCLSREVRSTGITSFGIIFFSILLFAGVLLLAFLVSCKNIPIQIPDEGCAGVTKWNTEQRGTDCKVDFEPLLQVPSGKQPITPVAPPQIVLDKLSKTEQGKYSHGQNQTSMDQEFSRKTAARWSIGASSAISTRHQGGNSMHRLITDSAFETNQRQRQQLTEQDFARTNCLRWSMGASTLRTRHQEGSSRLITDSAYETDQRQRQQLMEQDLAHANSLHWSKGSAMKTKDQKGGTLNMSWMKSCQYTTETEINIHRKMLLKVLTRMLYNIQAKEELSDYVPREYAKEGDEVSFFELDAISIPDTTFDPDLDPNLNFKFSTLASICMPGENIVYCTPSESIVYCTPSENIVYSTETSSVLERFETVTLM